MVVIKIPVKLIIEKKSGIVFDVVGNYVGKQEKFLIVHFLIK